MPRKNKVRVSVIQVQEFNGNEITNESLTPLEEVITEIPQTTGQIAESLYHFRYLHLSNL